MGVLGSNLWPGSIQGYQQRGTMQIINEPTLKKVDVVGPEALQTMLDGIENVLKTGQISFWAVAPKLACTPTYFAAESILVNQTNIIGALSGSVFHRLANREEDLYLACQTRIRTNAALQTNLCHDDELVPWEL